MLRQEQNIYYILRIACAMCFIGHGAFGIIGKAIWCNYFAVFGIGQIWAYQLMPVVGCIDILMGLVMMFYPVRATILWLAIWGLITATLRPLSGEPFPELIERAGNFGAPLVLLVLCDRARSLSSWFERMNAPLENHPGHLEMAKVCLRYITSLLLAGHGWLNLAGKKSLMAQYATLGFKDPHQIGEVAGAIEIGMALFLSAKPSRSFLLICLIWKIATELFYPHWEAFEWIERGGSYGALLAFWFAIKPETNPSKINYHSLKEALSPLK